MEKQPERGGPLTGQRLSHYEVLEKLGEGGMGVLYRARDTHLERTVALKVLRPEAVGDLDRRRRFVIEAKAASALNHPNIVTIYDINRTDGGGGIDFIAMECVDGRPLDQVIAGRRLPVDEALGYAIQIADALAAAHAAGIVHRDVKPGNVMLTGTGHVKVLDFGLAKLTERAPADDEAPTRTGSPVTEHGVIIGSASYMSSEQAEGRPLDVRTDVFSFGIVLYEMLSGGRPFHGDSRLSLMSAIVRDEPPPLTRVRPDVPAHVQRIVERCLRKDRDMRYPSARELHADLLASQSRLLAPKTGVGAIRRRGFLASALAALVLFGGVAAWLWMRGAKERWARSVALPEIARLAEKEDYVAAFRLANEAERYIGGDLELQRLWRDVAQPMSILTVPEGAEVRVKAYGHPNGNWLLLGRTPLENVRVPGHFLRWQIEKEGRESVELALSAWTVSRLDVALRRTAEGPAGMVHVPQGPVTFASIPRVELEEYWLDRLEVTNRQFKEFVDAGGYQKREYWHHPFVLGGRTLSWDEAMALFRDATGRPGPSTWELGTFPTDRADHPVSGVSWYEAAAHAAFAGKSLPTVYHWRRAAALGGFSDIVHFSNFAGAGPAPAGSHAGLGRYGTYDMAGNVKEWCWNGTAEKRYILGGSWNEPDYSFTGHDAQSPFDRSPRNGMRLARYSSPPPEALTRPIENPLRDYTKEKPVSDEVFAAYRSIYSYDRGPLDARLESAEDALHWRREKITFNAAYGGERVLAHLFLPKNATPPYQTVVHFGGAYITRFRSSENLEDWFVTFLIRSGRALLYPVYKGTYERGGGEGQPVRPDLRRDQVIQWSKDLGRSLDYLESRPDIDRERLAFYGFSLGAAYAPIFTAVEPRFRTSVLLFGGLYQRRDPSEIEAINFAPRAKIPALMLNGRLDFTFPLESAQRPLFRLLGAPAKDKRHVLFESGHAPPRTQEVMKEVLDWLDRYLGPVSLRPGTGG